MPVEPFFTVAIPVYNGETFIHKAVESVLKQTFTDWELVIIDDQSRDNTWTLLQKNYGSHPQIRLLQNAANLKQNGNCTRCLAEARGRWIGILPADDYYVHRTLETAHREISKRNDLVLWMHGHLVFGEGVVTNICPVYTDVTEFRAGDLADHLYRKGGLFGEFSSHIFDRAFAQKLGLIFDRGTQSVDLRFWIRLLHAAGNSRSAVYWPDMLCHVLQHAESGSSIFAADGRVYSDLFDYIETLSDLGWSRATLVYQILRTMKCWWKMGQLLPQNAKDVPRKTLLTLVQRLMKSQDSIPAQNKKP